MQTPERNSWMTSAASSRANPPPAGIAGSNNTQGSTAAVSVHSAQFNCLSDYLVKPLVLSVS